MLILLNSVAGFLVIANPGSGSPGPRSGGGGGAGGFYFPKTQGFRGIFKKIFVKKMGNQMYYFHIFNKKGYLKILI